MKTKKIVFLITGLLLVIFLFTLSTSGETAPLCSYSGPDLSDDLMRLTDFSVTGPSSLKEGDKIIVKFNLQNFGQYDLNLGTKGIFAGAKDPDNIDASFGFSRPNTTIKTGETASIEISRVLDKAGTWVIWPSYHLSLATGEKLGPNEWHACSLVVGTEIEDSDEDGISDDEDNCSNTYNPDQADIDEDGLGDACDSCDDRDSDGDGIKNCLDGCPDKPETFNGYQDEDGCPDEVPEEPEEEGETTPPTIEAIYSPETPYIDDRITFTAKAIDPSGIKGMTIFINGELKRRCSSKCQMADELLGKCFRLKERIINPETGEKEYSCIFTGGPYPVGTLTYKAKAVDNKDNEGESDEKQIEVRVEITSLPQEITIVGCFRSISGRINHFSYDYNTLKIKSCKIVPGEGMTLNMCSPGSTEYTDVSSEDRTYKIEGLCPDTSYLIEPVYRAAEGMIQCQWRGNWDPESNVVNIESSDISNRNFTFTPIEEDVPSVDVDYTPEAFRTGRRVSTGDRITFQVTASDDSGIAKVQIRLKSDYGEGYGEEEVVKECTAPSYSFPSELTCTLRGGPYVGVKSMGVKGVACDKNGNMQWNESYISFIEFHCLNNVKDADEQDIDCGGADCESCPQTCDDGIQNRNEEGIDCGGDYCPPCSQCETGAKWAPHDTPCRHHWPTDEGPSIGMNTSDDSCAIVEVCHPELDYIVEDAITCCEHSDYGRRFSGNRVDGKNAACRYARETSGIDINYNPVSFKKCLGVYAISSLGGAAVYMQGYFNGEWCCAGSDDDDLCPDGCSKWGVNPPVWEMGTALSCAGPGGERPDFQMGGHRCVYNKAGSCKIHCWKWGKAGYWNSDTDFTSNNDSVCDVPAHASINRLSTGSCVDYSFALTTILRKLGYSKDDVFSVNGEEHGYNLVKFPGETEWNYVDTVSNRCGEIYGGIGGAEIYNSAGDFVAGYDYCKKMDGGCSNDYYSESKDNCPSNNEIYTCERIPR